MVRKGKLTKKARKDKERHERELEDGRRANGQRVLIVCKNNSLQLHFSVEIPFVTQKIERKGNKTDQKPSEFTSTQYHSSHRVLDSNSCRDSNSAVTCAPNGVHPS